jgi:sugar-phosphatase
VRIEVDAVLLDSDGVLVDSHDFVAAAWSRLGDELGISAELEATELAGGRPVDILGGILTAGEAAAAAARLEALELNLAPGTKAMPGAGPLLAQLESRLWAVATSASHELATLRWRAAGLPLPAVAVTADDVANGKPDPEPYLMAAERLGVAPERCVVFEDSAAGGLAARGAGAAAIAVGDQDWTVEPAARIPDLRHVALQPAADRSIVLAIG